MLENVDSLRHRNHRRSFERIIRNLTGAGYAVHYAVLDARSFGLPQSRRRLFIVGFRCPTRPIDFRFPAGAEPAENLRDFLDRDVAERYYYTDDERAAMCAEKERNLANGGKWGYRLAPSTHVHCKRCGERLPRPSKLDERTGRHRIIPARLNSYGRMRADRPAPTLKQNFIGFESGMHLHPTQHRTLSPREALAVHTVSQYAYDWGGAGSTEVASAIGESVPPLFFEILARHLIAVAGDEPERHGRHVRARVARRTGKQ